MLKWLEKFNARICHMAISRSYGCISGAFLFLGYNNVWRGSQESLDLH